MHPLNKAWADADHRHILNFVESNYEFTGEELLAYVEDRIGKPPGRNLGGLIVKEYLSKNQLALKVGSKKSVQPQAKGRLVQVWRSIRCPPPDQLQSVGQIVSGLQQQVHVKKLSVREALYAAFQAGANQSV